MITLTFAQSWSQGWRIGSREWCTVQRYGRGALDGGFVHADGAGVAASMTEVEVLDRLGAVPPLQRAASLTEAEGPEAVADPLDLVLP